MLIVRIWSISPRKIGLKPLVFHVDAGWNSEIAVNNIEQLVERLDLDLYTEVINWEEMKDLQLAFLNLLPIPPKIMRSSLLCINLLLNMVLNRL